MKSNYDESVILAMKTEYNSFILQSVESDKGMLDEEWKSINWNSVEHDIFKIQKRIFEAEKNGDYRKVNRLCRLLVNDKRSLLYSIKVVTKENKGIEYAISSMKSYADKAKDIIMEYPDNDVRESLLAYVDYVVGRSY